MILGRVSSFLIIVILILGIAHRCYSQLETESEKEIQEEIISSLESFVTLFGQSHSWRWLDICKSIIVSSKIPSSACFRTQAGHENDQDNREDEEEQAPRLDNQSGQ